MGWTTTAELKHQVQKWWDRGDLLTTLFSPEPTFPKRLKLKAPTSQEMTEQFDEVRGWIVQLRNTPHCRIVMREFKHRVFGRNEIPSEVWLDNIELALTWIGKKREFDRFKTIVEKTRQKQPSLLSWLERHPLQALEHHENWDSLLLIIEWLQANPRPGIYLRQVDLPGIHTKVLESYRSVLLELLDLALPETHVEASAKGISQFARRYGFRDRPFRIRFRILDQDRSILPFGGEQDISLDSGSFSKLDPGVSNIFITENEINFLAFPQTHNSMVIFGAGYGFELWQQFEWFKDRRIYYWGDIDTHGFAILSSARKQIPQIQSLLMDEQTLLAHKNAWGHEPTQHNSLELPHLTKDEHAVYDMLKQQTLGPSIRLEQERIGWAYACNVVYGLIETEDRSTSVDCVSDK